MKIFVSAFIVLATLSAGPVGTESVRKSKDEAAAACKPTWKSLSKGPLIVKSGVFEAKFTALLIGCQSDLKVLDDRKLEIAQKAVKDMIGKEPLSLIRSALEDFRFKAAGEINRALGKARVTDIYFDSVTIGETM